jgi:hypothetical protein
VSAGSRRHLEFLNALPDKDFFNSLLEWKEREIEDVAREQCE